MFSFEGIIDMLGMAKRDRWTKAVKGHHRTPQAFHQNRRAHRRARLRMQKGSRRINFGQARKRR